ncbi:hypothetical protein [Pseudoduganella buxea]|uniref:Uncharacterized protein n=1 Tax=Pseudoduganella buxea TaxID=1949069 RepID=A0A6I3T2V0_9BURK|nr:hypothetical protein [Pseudoduganella buxea]MTV55950.1 hypothetical protein [Pseudoduganella buxea]
MTAPLRDAHLATLQAAGVVFAADAALAHPAWQALADDAAPGACRAWLATACIDDAGLLRTSRHIDASSRIKDRARLRAAVEEALFLLASGPERPAQDDLYPASEGWGTPGKPAPVVGEITQLFRTGYPRYPSSTRLRACRAPIHVGGTAVKDHKGRETVYVFTIERTRYAWSGFTMTDDEKPALPRVYDPALDDPGAPLGHDALERSFRAASRPSPRAAGSRPLSRRPSAPRSGPGSGAARPRRQGLRSWRACTTASAGSKPSAPARGAPPSVHIAACASSNSRRCRWPCAALALSRSRANSPLSVAAAPRAGG